MAKLFAHLFFTDAVPWNVLEAIRLTESDTTSSSRIFIKELMLQMSEYVMVSFQGAHVLIDRTHNATSSSQTCVI
jgi:pre-mRNA-splicing factor CWC22